jgi:membrane protease subunit (stomatin/prohibitin family)
MNFIASSGELLGGLGVLWLIFALALLIAPLMIWANVARAQRDQDVYWRRWMAKSDNLAQQTAQEMARQIGPVVAELRKLRYALDPKAELVDQEEAAAAAQAAAPPEPERKPNGKLTRQVRRMDCPGCKSTLEVPATGSHVCPHCGTAL